MNFSEEKSIVLQKKKQNHRMCNRYNTGFQSYLWKFLSVAPWYFKGSTLWIMNQTRLWILPRNEHWWTLILELKINQSLRKSENWNQWPTHRCRRWPRRSRDLTRGYRRGKAWKEGIWGRREKRRREGRKKKGRRITKMTTKIRGRTRTEVCMIENAFMEKENIGSLILCCFDE